MIFNLFWSWFTVYLFTVMENGMQLIAIFRYKWGETRTFQYVFKYRALIASTYLLKDLARKYHLRRYLLLLSYIAPLL